MHQEACERNRDTFGSSHTRKEETENEGQLKMLTLGVGSGVERSESFEKRDREEKKLILGFRVFFFRRRF